MSRYTVNINGKEIEYYIREHVSFEAAVMAYKKIIDAAFQAVEQSDYEFEINYAPFMVGLARDYALISLFTNIPLDDADNEMIWDLGLSDVVDNILADETRSLVFKRVCRWADNFIDDYKNRILTNKKRDELFDALRDTVATDSGALDMASIRDVANKISEMSEEDILKTIIDAQK